MEIERKFLLSKIPENLDSYQYHLIEQAYLCIDPVIRIRKEDDSYYITYKGSGLMAHDEYSLPLTEASYQHLLKKADGNIITKKRYLIPLSEKDINSACSKLLESHKLILELDEFDAPFAPLMLAEIEFPTVDAANAFQMLPWFSEDVTNEIKYHNSCMSTQIF